jgi:hypothetical protein
VNDGAVTMTMWTNARECLDGEQFGVWRYVYGDTAVEVVE